MSNPRGKYFIFKGDDANNILGLETYKLAYKGHRPATSVKDATTGKKNDFARFYAGCLVYIIDVWCEEMPENYTYVEALTPVGIVWWGSQRDGLDGFVEV